MADQITTVGIGVDTSQVTTAATALDNMAKAGGRAETAATRLEKAHAAMIAELRGIKNAVNDLGALSSAEGRAAQATKQRERAAAQSAVTSAKAASAMKEEARSIAALAPIAKQSADAIGKLSLSSSQVRTDGIKNITAELSAAATQAARTVSAISNAQKVGSVSFNLPTRPVSGASQNTQAAPNAAAINSATRATRTLAAAQGDQAKSARLAAFQNQQLGFQLHDFFVQVVSGQSPLTALVQQGSQLSGTFGGAGKAFKAVLGLLTPARIALGGVAAAVGAVGFAFYEGSKQSKAFADSIVLTGNFAGQTEAKFNDLAKSISSSGQVTVASAREAAQAVLSSGVFSPGVFNNATEAVALFAEATGQSIDDITKDFARASIAPAKFAEEYNRRLHFLTAAQLESIRTFEEQGRTIEAQGVIFDALNARLRQLDPNLGTIERTLRSVKNGWKSFWDSAYDIGRTETITDKLNKINAEIEQRGQARAASAQILNRPIAQGNSKDDELQRQKSTLIRDQRIESETADRQAIDAQTQQDASDSRARINSLVKESKATSELKKAREKLNEDFAKAELGGVGATKDERADALKALEKKFADKSGVSEAGQLLRASLDRDIKGINDAFLQERDAISFNERFLQGEYQAGRQSLEDLYKGKRDAIEKGVDAEVKALEAENKRLEQFAKQSKDPSEREQTKTKIVENNVDIERARLNASRDLKIVNQDEAASFKQLDDSISNYRANLLQLQGDEEGAVRVRAQSAIEQARVLSAQSVRVGRSPVDVEGLAKATEIQTQFNEVQRKSQFITSAARTAEEAFARAAEQRGLSQKDADTGIYLIRQKELEQLAALAAKAKELADASTNPQIKQFAAELANEYAKAAAAVDPALQRLRDANKELAQGLTNTVTNLPNTFADVYKKRRTDSFNDIKSQKDEYNRRIDILEGYLAESQDKQDKARLREKIKNLESERDSKKQKSKGSSLLGALNDSLIQPAVQQVTAGLNKVLVADPLQKLIEGQLKGLTEGDGLLGGFFKDALGIKTDPKEVALDAQTAAVVQSTSALDLLTQAAQNAAGALPGGAAGNPLGSAGSNGNPPPVDSELSGLLDDFGGNLEDSNTANVDMAKTVPIVTNALTKLASVTGSAGQALGILPAIISLISSTTATSSASSAGGLFGALFSAYAGSSGSGSGAVSNELFHDGGIVGSPTAYRTTAASVFNNATRYHKGGLAGLKADEVPAILMGGAKGKREEVLKADDPRHRDNLGKEALAAIMHESKYNKLRPRGNRALGGDVSSNSLYRVNENKPELLEVAGKQYLMMGNQSGQVNATQDKQKPIVMNVHFDNGGKPVDRNTQGGIAAAAYQGARRAYNRNK